jgi:hypothetical protein
VLDLISASRNPTILFLPVSPKHTGRRSAAGKLSQHVYPFLFYFPGGHSRYKGSGIAASFLLDAQFNIPRPSFPVLKAIIVPPFNHQSES